eukprot:Seg1790.5 transcript_id=Seg1790.5/GoldUCD/mRNA.D3Y31 product="hypothetical protein" protein_id=Seg1790.5/GoldUCD/D3Y31
MSANGGKWQDDSTLKSALIQYNQEVLQRKEILSYMKRDFPQYKWSTRTLDRRLRFSGVYRTDPNVTVDQLRSAVEHEISGPGKLLGVRAMHNVIRQKYHLNVPRIGVHAIMYDLDQKGLEEHLPKRKQKRARGNFTTRGPNWVFSLDGHAKLMGFEKGTFPLAIYGCIDTATRKIMYLKVWTGNSDPKLIGRWYFDFVMENEYIPAKLRIDKGTERGEMATIHAFLRQGHGDMDPADTVIYGPSTSNQIERWWRELHERLEMFFKHQLSMLKDEGHYDPHNQEDRSLLAFVFIPVLQKQLDAFKDIVLNTHRIRAQRGTALPNGIPSHIYDFPEEYNLIDCRKIINQEDLAEIALHSNILDVEEDYLEADFREKCENLLPNPVDEMKQKQEMLMAYSKMKMRLTLRCSPQGITYPENLILPLIIHDVFPKEARAIGSY